jgi:hypothetical protein
MNLICIVGDNLYSRPNERQWEARQEEEAPAPIEPSAGGGKLYYHKFKNVPSEFRKEIRWNSLHYKLSK